ncbi:TolC family outer membrane protein [Microbulbifer sp.]|uniref:TolC family outer membrane protein n=1 Tax=Microbulbifer sp. TaxID=1908541 RepID=UPI003F3AB530
MISGRELEASLQPEVVESESPAVNYSASRGQYPSTEIGLVEAVHRAVDWHPSISEAIGSLNEREENVRAARAGYFPQLSVNLIAGRDNEDRREGDGHAIQIYASQLIYDFGKVSSDVDLATAGARRSQAVVLKSIDRIAHDTAMAAIEVLRYQARLKTSQEQIKGLSAIASLVQMRNEKGASSRSDVLQAQTRIEAARATKQRVLGQLNRERSTLQNLMGTHSRVTLSMNTSESVAPACRVDNPDFSSVPDLLIAQASYAEAVAQVKNAKARSWPTLSLDASVNNYLDPEYVDANSLNEHESSVFLNLSMPIYQGGRIDADRQSSTFALRSAEAAVDAARQSVVGDFRATQEEADGLTRSLSILDARERAIAETRDLYSKQYFSLGTRTLLDLLNAEDELHRARVEIDNTRYDLNRLQVECLYSAGEIRSAFRLEGREIQGLEILP